MGNWLICHTPASAHSGQQPLSLAPSGICEECKALGVTIPGSLQPGPSTIFLCAAETPCLGMGGESEPGTGR